MTSKIWRNGTTSRSTSIASSLAMASSAPGSGPVEPPTPPERPQDEIRRLRAVVHGRVQGVNYRRDTEDTARALGLVGYVRNHWDRTVEVVAEGPAPLLEQLLVWLHEGPPLAHVTQVDLTWQVPTHDLDDFEVRW